MTFNDGEKALLRELAMNATWASIVRKLREFHRDPPKYVPGGETSSKQQEDDWKFYSGVDRGRSDLLKLLGHE